MNHLTWTVVLLVGAAMAGGCQSHRYASEPLGDVGHAQAFRAGKAVLSQHFSIASADEAAGKLVSRPAPVDAGRDRLVGSSPARQVATMRIREEGQQIYADIRIDIQRQDLGAMRHMQPVTVDNQLPNQTPAQRSAAVTPDQDQAWQNTGRNERLERLILDEVMAKLAKKP